MNRQRRVGGLLALLAVVLVALLLGNRLLSVWHQPLQLPEGGALLSVTPGDSLQRVLGRAETSGWLRHARWIGFIAARLSLDGRIHVGEYRVGSGSTAASLVHQLAQGDTHHYDVTLPEGITLAQALRILCAEEAIQCELTGANDPRLLDLVSAADTAEGWFLPETYRFVRGDTDLTILRRAHALMREALDAAWQDRAPETTLRTPYEALILASIIERETGVASERPAIAGVFHRRLQRGMRLQTDPSVIYGLGEAFDGNLTRRHLQDVENPYNTYRIPGLPPSPIALPGRAALAAALAPAAGDALFFVARGDGSHAFAATLEEHESNVRRFQLQRRSDYRSSPP